MSASLLTLATTPASADPASITVTSAADSGPGSLRDALATASADPNVTQIVISPQVGRISPTSTLVYSGPQELTINGGGSVLDGTSVASGAVFTSTASPAVTVRQLAVSNGPGDGLVLLNVSSVQLSQLTATNNGAQGVLIDDGGANDHGVDVSVVQSTFDNNGTGVCDTDGLRVNESGDGSITSSAVGLVATNNDHDGVEYDERGAGDAVITVRNSSFNDNGLNDCLPFDLEDGLDIDELDAGNVSVDIASSLFTGNEEEGLDIDEDDGAGGTGPGDLFVQLTNVDTSNNGTGAQEDNIDIDESLDGNYTVVMTNVTSNGAFNDNYDGSETGAGDLNVTIENSSLSGSTDGRGIDLQESDDGAAVLTFSASAVDGNSSDGVRHREGGTGDLGFATQTTSLSNNGSDGAELGETGAGFLTATLDNSTLLDNSSAPVRATQDAGLPPGTLTLAHSTFGPNANVTSNVTETVIP